MTAPVERKLPGQPVAREELVRDYDDWKRANLLDGPGRAAIFDLLVPKPDETYQWRVELDCGCIRDAVTLGDDVASLLAKSDTYHFSMQKPSEREIAEATEQMNEEIREDLKAKRDGDKPPIRPHRPSVRGKDKLPPGQWLCQYNSECRRYRSHGGPVRDIVEWARRRDDLHTIKPLEIDGKVIRPAKEYALWDVVLGCGHFHQERTEPDWKPDDGIGHNKPSKKWRGLEEMLEMVAHGDPDEEEYWRRVYAENHPEPVPFTRCHTCACLRSVVAYQRVGWVAPKPKPIKPVKPKPPRRETLQRRLQKLESEAAQLREQLKNLPREADPGSE
ncbi:hypothetical protein [Mycobacterium noviomagense]|uniref:Uncharacterized protein n=1 Tax=Mycobacterium noviomagense TaxID=459858 RepID=A0A7I7PA10_9MYCO|nr:hypothetical protein [Mycobacterium noviomagense]ORB12996.1 hypothetical protein BST37_14905 [Mycobacterium noviomagense]BBY05408.1 hypothetical protein MNVI_07260 [Mycobacterium noviomagense]